MFGIILGFGAAIAFAFNAIITRRGVLRVSSNYVANISILTGPVFSLVVALVTGHLYEIGDFPWKACVFFSLSGIVHFAFGRTWGYKALQLIGSNRANIVTSLSPIISVILAILVLGETVDALMVVGIFCALSSPFLTLLQEHTIAAGSHITGSSPGKEIDHPTLYLGMLYGMGAALFWGSSFIFIKLGLANGGTPIAGNMIAYLAASIAIIPSLLKQENLSEMRTADRKSLKLALLVGLTTNIAQLLRYVALQYGSVIVVTAVIRTSPLGVLLLSYIFNRQYESFSRPVLLSNALSIIGTVLILFGS